MKSRQYPEMQHQPTGRIITIELFTIDELSDDARERAYNDWLEEPSALQIEYYLQDTIDYDARKALDPIIPNWNCDAYGHIWPIMRNVKMPNDGHAPRMKDCGDWATMDIADAFNAYGHEMEEYANIWYRIAYPESGSAFYECDDTAAYDLLGLYEDLYLQTFEKAAQAALSKWEELREAEREYHTSTEAFEDEFNQGYECRTIDRTGRVYLNDCRKWYTANGEFYEQSDITHECVSIVATDNA